MIAFLLAARTRKFWHLPPWLTPDTEHIGLFLVRLVLTLVAAWLAQRVLFMLVHRGEHWLVRAGRDTGHRAQRARTVGQIVRHAVTAMLVAWAFVHTLEIFGWDVKPLIVGATVLGAAFGFGAQFLVRDVIAGIFIFVEDQFVVGDAIEVNGQPATVEAVTLRSTRLRDFQGRELHVPNGEMKIVVNHSRGWNRAIVDLPVAAGQDLGEVLRVTGTVVTELNDDSAWGELLVEPFAVVGFERVGADGALLRIVARALPGGDAARLSREVRLRVLQRWKAEGIRTVADPLGDRRRWNDEPPPDNPGA